MRTGIAAIPNPEFINKLICIQAFLRKKMEVSPALCPIENPPHLTLIQNMHSSLGSGQEAFEKFCDSVNQNHRSELRVMLNEVSYVDVGWCFLDLVLDDNLKRLHEYAFQVAEPFLKPPDAVDKEKTSGYSIDEMENYLKHGYRFIGDSYRPHITVGRINIEKKALAIKMVSEQLDALKVQKVQKMEQYTLYTVGPNGAHQQTLRSIAI